MLGLGSLFLCSHEKAKEWGGKQRVLGPGGGWSRHPMLSLGGEIRSSQADGEDRDLGRRERQVHGQAECGSEASRGLPRA